MKLKKHIGLFIKALLAIILIWFLSNSGVLEFSALKQVFKPQTWLFLALFLMAINIVFSAARWCILLNVQGIEARPKECIKPTYMAFALGQFLPGGVAGDIIKAMFVVKLAPDKKTRGITSIFIDRAIGLLAVIWMVFFALILHHGSEAEIRGFSEVLYVCAAIVFASPALFLLPESIGISRFISARLKHEGLVKVAMNFIAAVGSVKRSPAKVSLAFFISIIIQLVFSYSLYCLSKNMGFEVAFFHIMLASGFAQIASIVPITPGGIGVGEAAFAGMLALLGYPATLGLGAVLLGFRVTSVIISIPAYFMYFTSRKF